MRAIDADKINFNEIFIGASDFAKDTRKAAQMFIDNQPTVYEHTGLFDKAGREIKIGDKTKLILDSGEERIFDVCFKTVTRTVKCHPDFDDRYSKVKITGVVFCWNGYDLFPCVNEKGESDVSKMEIIQ